MAQSEGKIVVDHGKSSLSDLWTKEDYLAIWLGFLVIAVCLIAYFGFGPKEEFARKITEANQIQQAEAARAPFKTIEWYQAENAKKLKASSTAAFGKFVTHWTKTPGKWETNPLDSFIRTEAQVKAINDKAAPAYEEAKAKAEAALSEAQQVQQGAAAANFQDQTLNEEAKAKIADWRAAE
jgi:hypothetical protein